MTQRLVFTLALVAAVWPCSRLPIAQSSEIIPQTTALQDGLRRAWFTQIQLDRARGRIAHIVLHQGTLFVGTDRAVVHAVDAETGQTLWAKQVGRPEHPSLRPGANSDLVAVINGSFLYLLGRFDGKLLWKSQLEGPPGAGPALSDDRAFVPAVEGMMMVYHLRAVADSQEGEDKGQEELTPEEIQAAQLEHRKSLRLQQERVAPVTCRSSGRAMVQPVITRQTEHEQYVVWPTDRGFLFIGRLDLSSDEQLTVRYRLSTGAGIVAQPTYLPPDPKIVGDSGVIYGASLDGFVYAILEESGDLLWEFSTGEPILQPAVVIGLRVYVVTQLGGMYVLDAKAGTQQWWTPNVIQFVTASKDRIYAADKRGRILVLDAKSGARLDSLPTSSFPLKLLNVQTDRIYLATKTGLVQCLHEVESTEPFSHASVPEKKEEKPAAGPEGAEPKKTPPPPGGADPFAPPPPASKAPKKPAAETDPFK